MSDDAGGQSEDTRGGVYSRSFLALVATQFFVSLNDNMFRWLVVPIGKELIGKRWSEMPEIVQTVDEAGRRWRCRWGWHVSRCRSWCLPRRPASWPIASANAT